MNRMLRWVCGGLAAALCLGSSGCVSRDAASLATPQEQADAADTPPEVEKKRSATLLAVGDNLIHDVIYLQAQTETGDGYDFKPIYARLQKQIAAADIAFINQETQMSKSAPPAGYPMFNTPVEMADNLREVGFDVLGIANNHMLDQGTQGLAETIALIDATQGLALTGAYDTPERRNTMQVVEKNGIRFAFLGFTQHTNGLSMPEEKAYMAIYTDDSEEIKRQVAQAKANADLVVASVHWGEENTPEPTDYQRAKAAELAEYGVDIILGTHPHVLQPIEWISRSDGGRTLVLYSLGNFVSAQIDSMNLIGGMAEIQLELDVSTGEIQISNPEITPVITHYGAAMRDSHLYPLSEYTEELAQSHGVRLSYGKTFDLPYIYNFLDQTIGQTYLVKSAA